MSWLPWCCWTFYMVSWLFGLWALALMLRWCLVVRGPPSTLGILSWQGSHQLTGSPSAPVLSEFGVLRAAWVSGLRVACVPRQLYVCRSRRAYKRLFRRFRSESWARAGLRTGHVVGVGRVAGGWGLLGWCASVPQAETGKLFAGTGKWPCGRSRAWPGWASVTQTRGRVISPGRWRVSSGFGRGWPQDLKGQMPY